MAGAKQSVHWFLGGMVALMQQGTNVWFGMPSPLILSCEVRDEYICTTSIRGFRHMVNNYTKYDI